MVFDSDNRFKCNHAAKNLSNQLIEPFGLAISQKANIREKNGAQQQENSD